MSYTTPFLEQWKKDAQALHDRLVAKAFGVPTKQPQKAIAYRGGGFVSLDLDDAGNVIEPCRKCGPVLLCSDCMSKVT